MRILLGATLCLVLLLAAAPGRATAAGTAVASQSCMVIVKGSPEDPCSVLGAVLTEPCLAISVEDGQGRMDTPAPPHCPPGSRINVTFDDRVVHGSISSRTTPAPQAHPRPPPASPSSPPSPPSASAPSAAVPSASADVEVDLLFELRLEPCSDATLHLREDAGVTAGPAGSEPESDTPLVVPAQEACDRAQHLAGLAPPNIPSSAVQSLAAALVEAAARALAPPAGALPLDAPSATPLAPVPAFDPTPPTCVCAAASLHASAAVGPASSVAAHASASTTGKTALPAEAAPPRPHARAASALGLDDAPRVAVHAEPQPAPHEAARRASDPTQERLPPENGKAVTRARPATTAGPSAPAHPEPPGLDLLRASAGGFAVSLLLNLLAGYSRIAPDRLLDHPVRRRVHEAASRPGGATVRSVATELGCAESTARYHLEVLRRGGKLRVAVSPLGASYHSPAAPPALQGPPPTLREQIPHAVAASPGMNMSELARRLGVSKRSVQDHVLALLAEGRIESQRAVGARLLFPKGA